MIGLGLGLVRQAVRNASGQAWTPAQLFANGEQGVWYEPRPEYLYQDAAGTTPVTADGDPVGLMLDLSGNGNHATQSTSAARPTYRTDGTLHWLEFDGVDDFLSIPVIALASVVSAATSVTSTDSGDARAIIGLADGGSYLAASSIAARWRTNEVSLHNYASSQEYPYVLSAVRDEAGDVRVWANGDQSADVLNRSAINADRIHGSGSEFRGGRFLPLIVSESPFVGSERESAEAYIATRAGITL